MYYYILYGEKLKSDIEFPQLIVADETKSPNVIIKQDSVPEDIYHRMKEENYNFSQKLSWLENRTLFMWSVDGTTLCYQLKQNANLQYVRTYLLGFGMAMLHMQKYQLAIHCSAISYHEDAILILGESGAGKSTLTSKMLSKGYQLMADDMAVVKNYEHICKVFPAFPGQKICRDAAIKQGYKLEELIYIDEMKDKFFLPCKSEFNQKPANIKLVIYLGFTESDEVIIDEITGVNKIWCIKNNLFLRNLLINKKIDPYIVEQCIKMAAQVPIYAIHRPFKADTIDIIYHKVDEILKSI